MSKIESGKLEITAEPFDLPRAMGEVSAIIASRCAEKNITFRSNIGALGPLVVVGDKLRLNQVLINLLGNAVKFTPAGGTITFLVEPGEEDGQGLRVCFEIADTGIGMTAEQLARLFVPFEQADNSIAARFGGTGLGLSISKSLVAVMGGEIKVKSVPDRGSIFGFGLVFAKGRLCAVDADEAPKDLDLTGRRVLLVEDVEINRTIVRELLASSCLEIHEAEDGLQALEVFAAAPEGCYQMIFMDIQMPEMDGYETARAIRGLAHPDAARVPIVAMTANAYKEDVDRAIAAGMNAHISKPIDLSRLLTLLRAYLG